MEPVTTAICFQCAAPKGNRQWKRRYSFSTFTLRAREGGSVTGLIPAYMYNRELYGPINICIELTLDYLC